MTHTTSHCDNMQPIWRMLLKRISLLFAFILAIDLLLFVPAGRLDWPAAWVFTLGMSTLLLVYTVWGTFCAPELLAERAHRAENIKHWDKVIMRLYSVLLVILLIVAGLDFGRIQGPRVPRTIQVVALIIAVLACGLIAWVIAVNAFLSRMVRIQTDRGHQVVTTGPYSFVRHPMYVGLLVLFPCIPLSLGSWWALVFGGLIDILFVIRTWLEDRALQKELPGYALYAQSTRFRLLPGVW